MWTYSSEVQTPIYKKPCLEWIDRIEFSNGLNFPTLTLFSGDGSESTIERIARFTSQCTDAETNEFIKLRLFACS